MAAEGAAKIVVVSDDPERHQGDARMPKGTEYRERRDLDLVQRELREVPGVTVLIYDQQCATERRRKRKRGTQAVATKRVAINPRVCEDCGDCSRTSNCLAVEPIETAFGRKRAIDQSACNQDLSCVEGFCPSFVTLVGAEPVKKPVPKLGAALPEPARPEPREGEPAFNILLAGVGGQGVTALSAILGMAAHLEGRPSRSVDMLGLAQKGGGVFAQLRIGRAGAAPETIEAPRIGMGQADLLLSADMVVAHGRTARPLLGADRTAAVLNVDLQPTAQFVLDTAHPLRPRRHAGQHPGCLPRGGDGARRAGGGGGAGRPHLPECLAARHRLPEGAGAASRRGDQPGAGAERRADRAQQGGLRAGPRGGAGPAGPGDAGGGDAGRAGGAPGRRPDRLPECRLCPRLRRVRRQGPRRRAGGGAGRAAAGPRRGAAALPADGLQGRVRGGPAAQPDGLEELPGRALHRHAARRAEPGAALPGQARPGDRHAAQDRLRPLDAAGDGHAAAWQGAARHGARPLRPDRGAADGTRPDRPNTVPGSSRLLRLLSPKTHAKVCEWAEAAAGIKGYGHIKARNAAAARARMAEIEAGIGAPAPLAMAAE